MITTDNKKTYQELFGLIHNGVFIINREGLVIYCNEASLSLLDENNSSPIGKHINELVEHPLEMAFLEGRIRSNIWRTIKNRTILINQSPIYKDGEIIGAINIFQNSNELASPSLHHLEDTQKEVSKLKGILELLYNGILISDKEGIITMINDAYCEFLGIKMTEAVGKHVTQVIPNSRMHIVVKTGQSDIGELMKVKNKEIIVSRHPIRENGEIVGVIGKVLFTNVKDLVALTQRLGTVESKIVSYQKELKRVRGAKYSFDNIVGENEKMKEAKRLALIVAKSRSTVLIRGESGTGKELFVHAVHEASDRSEGPLVRINCAAIPANILESELFGYEEGTFTGANKGGRAGKIEQAHGGTLFLDEIGDMPLHMQVKLLRVLQEKEIERLGSSVTKQVDIRLISATNRPLEDMVKSGEFREDFFYRINVFYIHIPPLRERGKDILTTAHFLLGKLCDQLRMTIKGFHPDVEKLFNKYNWPGNVREMENVIERALHLTERGLMIELEQLPPYLENLAEQDTTSANFLLETEIRKAEIKAIKRALKATDDHRVKAAELLGIHRASLYRKLEKYDLIE